MQIATQDSGTYRKMASVIEQLRARNAQLIVMVNEGDPLLTSPGTKGLPLHRGAYCHALISVLHSGVLGCRATGKQ